MDDASPPVPLELVAFDIGEVLIDESRVWAIWAGLVGCSPLTFGAVLGAAISQGRDLPEVFGHVAPNMQWEELSPEFERRLEGLQIQDLYDDVLGCLDQLADLDVRVVVAGNQPARRRVELEALPLRCENIVTSEELGVEKPEPAFFTTLLEHFDVATPSSMLYVGDRVDNDILPAAALGVRTCWIRRGPWGLLQDVPDDVQPDLVLEGLGELPTLLAEWNGT